MTDLSFENWMTQLRKGLLELAVLNAISAAPLYGYDIVRRLTDVDHLVITEGRRNSRRYFAVNVLIARTFRNAKLIVH